MTKTSAAGEPMTWPISAPERLTVAPHPPVAWPAERGVPAKGSPVGTTYNWLDRLTWAPVGCPCVGKDVPGPGHLAGEDIRALAGDEGDRLGSAFEVVGADTADQGVVTAAADEGLVARAGGQPVIALTADEGDVARDRPAGCSRWARR